MRVPRILMVLGLMLWTVGLAQAELPYAEQGLSKQEAAAHLLSRFSYGPTPGQVDEVAHQGLEAWFEQQLRADLPETELQAKLDELPAMTMTSSQIVSTYPQPGMILRQAQQEGIVPARDEQKNRARFDDPALVAFMDKRGYRPLRELLGTLFSQKILRANESPNQLREVMTDFWFNHFNVSLTDNQARPYLLSYERDAIRPNALGTFRELLEATAKHPAMLLYLDNAQSSANPEAATTSDMLAGDMDGPRRDAARAALKRMARRKKGINENYARELMELFCLGEGHYDERDVQQAARCFTGWEVRRDAFFFNVREHDADTKTLFGDSGPFDGDEAVERILRRPEAPRHVAARLVSHFVTDERLPPETLQPLADSLREHDFQLAPVVRQVLCSRAFFSSWCVGRRVRSPLDLAVGLLRALEGSTSATALAETLRPLGQRPFFPPSVKGWPGGRAWINATTMLGRVNLAARLLGHESTRFGGDALAAYVERQGAASPGDVVDWLAERLLAVELPSDARQALVALASAGPAEQSATRALGGLAALPQFQLC
ncbi:MAG: DUF1800 domain-containing protein [Candidatus Eremiobacteraeota bacterium]|nr:DUF1800 domain-containing protein [Candidatus Eremiobacteraeota bacterium]